MHLQPIVTALCSPGRAPDGDGEPCQDTWYTLLWWNQEREREMRIRCRGAVALSRLVVKPRDEFPWTGNVSC